mgnify:CR=1 FL=1
MPLGLSQESALALQSLGQLDKSFLDKVYGDLSADQNAEDNAVKDTVAQQLASAIQTNPEVADVAARVQAAVSPTPTAAPMVVAAAAPAPTPVAVPAPVAAVVPTPAPIATAAPAVVESLPTAPPELEQRDPNTFARPGGGSSSIVAAEAAAEAGSKSGVYDAISQGLRMKEMAALAGAENARGASGQAASIYNEAAQKLGGIADAYAQKRETIEALRTEQIQKQIAAVEEFNTLQINPDQYWGSRSTFQKVAAGLGMIFSAAGGGTKGMDVINKAIADDIQIQKDNFALKKQGLDVRNTLLSQMHDVVGDVNDAQKLAQVSMLDQVKLRLEAAQSVAKGQGTQAALMETLGNLKIEQGKLMAEVAKNADNQIKVVGATTATGSPLPVIPDNTNALELPKELQKRYISGLGIAQDDEVAERIRKGRESLGSMTKSLDELKQLREKRGVEYANSRDRAKAKTLWFSILNGTRGMEALGALDQGTVDVFGAAIPEDPLGPQYTLDIGGTRESIANQFGDPLIAQIEQYKKNIQNSFNSKVKSGLAAITPQGAKYIQLQTGGEKYEKLPGSK